MLIDLGAPNPLVSIPMEMWNNGFSEFSATWQKCDYEREVLDNGRIMFTILIGETHTSKKVCLYHGTRDTTHKSWDVFESYLNQSITKNNGYSYIAVDENDNREWYEFHIYTENTENISHRPKLIFDPSIAETLND